MSKAQERMRASEAAGIAQVSTALESRTRMQPEGQSNTLSAGVARLGRGFLIRLLWEREEGDLPLFGIYILISV